MKTLIIAIGLIFVLTAGLAQAKSHSLLSATSECSHIGTPTISGFGTGSSVIGTDCVGVLTTGDDYNGGGTLTFAQPFNNPPLCFGGAVAGGIRGFNFLAVAGSELIVVTTSEINDLNFIIGGGVTFNYICPSY